MSTSTVRTKRAAPRTRAETVADELRRRIQSGKLAPGTRLRQGEIAELIGVSTTPVREAFTALAREGLIRYDAHRGAIVFLPSIDELREIYEIRIVLEPLATALATDSLSEQQLDRLEEIVNRMRVTADPHKYLELNRAFHTRIYEAARRQRLTELIDNLRDAGSGYIALLEDVDDPVYAAEVQAEHEEILAALRRRDSKRAAAAVARHLQNSLDHQARRVQRGAAKE
jgi:DNA-binding GntR family transcriptional regulator